MPLQFLTSAVTVFKSSELDLYKSSVGGTQEGRYATMWQFMKRNYMQSVELQVFDEYIAKNAWLAMCINT
eukprot:1152599-Amphidinium_carterae.1